MSFNIVDLVKDQISDQLLGQLSGVLGAGPQQTSGALEGALPGLLGGLTNAASSPSGAGALFSAVQDQDDGLLGNIGNLLGSDQSSNISSGGSSLLTSLMGDRALGQLAGVVASVAGVSRGNSGSLLGMLAPIIIGVLKKKVFDGGLNAGTLSSMLNGQKDNVGAAMPQAFSSQLQSAGFFDSIAPDALSALGNPQHSTASPAPVAAAASAPAPTHEKSGGGLMKWAIPLVVIAGIAWFGMQFMNKQAGEEAASLAETAAAEAESAKQVATEKAEALTAQAEEAQAKVAESANAALDAAQASMPAGVDLSKISGGLDGVFGSTSESLTGITDIESAKNAIPALQETAGKLGGLNDLIARLPEAAKGPIGSIVQNGIGTLEPLVDKISAIPGVGSVIDPIVAPIMEMLSGMAG